MSVDAMELLRECDVEIVDGRGSMWVVRGPNGRTIRVGIVPAVDRIMSTDVARALRMHRGDHLPLIPGESITDDMLARARSGAFNVVTANPLRLVLGGQEFSAAEGTDTNPTKTIGRRRPAWLRWAVMRCLLLAEGPVRQSAVADAIGGTQQSVSAAAQHLGDLVDHRSDGLVAPDRKRLLDAWAAEYPGPGGQEFGWYSLDPVPKQADAAAEIAALCDAEPLLSGDVAADRVAPWKLPTRGKIYISRPVDLEDDGFVPAPTTESTLITCIPQDPTLWRPVAALVAGDAGSPGLADLPTIYWDVLNGRDVDNAEAAARLADMITEEA
ncbi:hypothetical protein ACUXNS_000809 [Brevibacterium pityocampae]